MPIHKDVMDEKWVRKHAIPCMGFHVKKETINDVVFPIMDKILEKSTNTDNFIKEMANSLGELENKDIDNVINCITSKIHYVSEENGTSIVPSFSSRLARSVLGKSVLIMSKEVGYLK